MPARGQQFKERVDWVWGVQSDFLSPSPHSGGVKFLEAGQRGTDIPLSSLLISVLVAEPNSYRWTQDSLKDGRVELFQQLLWQVMNIVMFEADVIIVSWLGRFLKECLSSYELALMLWKYK